MDLQLAGKTAIITGGSRGIGNAIAASLAAEGVEVALAARGESALVEAAREISEATGRRTLPLVCDTGDDAAVRGMVERVVAEFGGVDILVNNAAKPSGQAPPPTMDELTDELFWDDMNVKVMGYLRCARAVAPHMRARHWGRIINISGMAARQNGHAGGQHAQRGRGRHDEATLRHAGTRRHQRDRCAPRTDRHGAHAGGAGIPGRTQRAW